MEIHRWMMFSGFKHFEFAFTFACTVGEMRVRKEGISQAKDSGMLIRRWLLCDYEEKVNEGAYYYC